MIQKKVWLGAGSARTHPSLKKYFTNAVIPNEARNPYFMFLILFAILILSGCAQIFLPTGGPKDVTPPKVLAYYPGNKSTLSHPEKIDITFDEYIQLKDLAKQFIISPPLKYLPVPLVKGRVLEISLKKDTLLENTTYTFNFGNAVTDLNENNPIKNFQYVFSTGTYVDSLSIHGTALDAFSHAPIQEGLVLLYSNMDDSIPYKKNPSYCGQTDDNGYYHIDNIKNGNYRLLALTKGSGDYLYHPYTQSIGFYSDTFSLQKNDTFNFFLFTEEQPKLQFSKAKALGRGQILLTFNKAVDSIGITPVNLKDTVKYNTLLQYSATHDSLTYWIDYPNLDSLRFIISHNNKPMDTAGVYNIPGHTVVSSKKNKKPEKPPALQLLLNVADKAAYDFHLPFFIQSPNPVTGFNLSRIFLTHRADTIPLKQTGKPSSFNLSLLPTKDLISDSTYKITILPGAFTDFFNYTNDTTSRKFTIQEQNYFGTLAVALSFSKKSHYIVQLLDEKINICRQDTVSGTTSIFYDGLPPAGYYIRVIKDDNNNGKWDIGSFLKQLQPEMVYYYPDKINIRSNWDLTQSWKVN